MPDGPSIQLIAPSAPYFQLQVPQVPGLTFYALSSSPGGGSAAGVSALNSLTGFLTVVGAGNISVSTDGINQIFVSGNNVGGAITQSQLDALSGWAAPATGLTKTGSFLYSMIVGLSGADANTYATLLNVTQSGVQLGAKIDSLSGFTLGLSGGNAIQIAQTGQQAWNAANNNGINLSGNLTQTGVQLGTKIDTVSGWVITTVSGGLEARIIATGNSAVTQANSIGATLSGNLTQTGIQSLNYAAGIGTIISGNLTSTGVQLGAKIDLVSGWTQTVVSGGLEVRITATGNSAVAQANSVGTTLSGNLTQTGIQVLNYAAGIGAIISGNLTATGQQLSAVKVTGSSIINIANFTGLGGTLVFWSGGQIFISGAGAGAGGGVTSLNAVGGVVNLLGTGGLAVLTIGQNILISGDQSISGALTQTGIQLGAKIDSLSGFTLGASGALQALIAGGGSQVRVSGSSTIPIADFTGIAGISVLYSGGKIFLSGTAAGAAGVTSVNGVAGVINILGTGGLAALTIGQNIIVSGDQSISGALTQTGIQALNYAAGIGSIISGNLTSTGVQLGSKIDTVSGWVTTVVSGGLEARIIATGNSAVAQANSIGVTISGNLTQTGIQALNFAAGIGTIISGNLTSTGVQLGTKIDLVSGWTSTVISGGLEVRIIATGNSAVAQANSIGTTLSGNLTQTGIQAFAFANGIGTTISGNLTSTGVQLGAKINSLSGFTIGVSGALQAQIVGGGGTQVRVTGSSSLSVADFTGIGGAIVFSSGGQVFISGGAGGSGPGGGTSVTISGSSVLSNADFSGVNGIAVYQSGSSVLISGNFTQIISTGELHFTTGLQTGLNNYFIEFIPNFAVVPHVQITEEIFAGTNYLPSIKSRTTSGVFISLSSTLLDAGYYLNVLAQTTTGSSNTYVLGGGGGGSVSVTGSLPLATANFTGVGGNTLRVIGNTVYVSGESPFFANFSMSIDNKGQTIPTGYKGYFQLGMNMTILGWNMAAMTSGSIVVDINKSNLANFPVFSSIIATGTGFPSLNNANKVYSTSVSGWQQTTRRADYFEFVVKGCTGISKINLTITGTRI